MLKHHEEALNSTVRKLEADPDINAILLGGSLAHGYAKENSDVDIMIVINKDRYAEMEAKKNTLYFDKVDEIYDGGYVDGKFITVDYINLVAIKGSEPARYAFKDSVIVFSRIEGLDGILRNASRFPIENKGKNIIRFFMQLTAWKWYYHEAKKKSDIFLIHKAVSNFVLFAGRMMLAYNERLYPYLKWLFKELEKCDKKPVDFIPNLNRLVDDREEQVIEKIYEDIKTFSDWKADEKDWGNFFLRDVEQVWMSHEPCISDI
jgi:predicted nucleotidyltransferase